MEENGGRWERAGNDIEGMIECRRNEMEIDYCSMGTDAEDGIRQPLLLRKRTMNTTSQIALVGANICPIESLDYELVFFIHP